MYFDEFFCCLEMLFGKFILFLRTQWQVEDQLSSPPPAVGKTKVFMKDWHAKELDALRGVYLSRYVICIQKYVRGWIARRNYVAMQKATVCIQKWVRGHLARRAYLWMRWAVILIQSLCRMSIAKKKYLISVKRVVVVQSLVRRWAAKRKLENLKEAERKRIAKLIAEQEAREKLERETRERLDREQQKLSEEKIASMVEEELRMKREKEEKEEEEKKRQEEEEAEKQKLATAERLKRQLAGGAKGSKVGRIGSTDLFASDNNPFESIETIAQKKIAPPAMVFKSPRVMKGLQRDVAKTPRSVQSMLGFEIKVNSPISIYDISICIYMYIYMQIDVLYVCVYPCADVCVSLTHIEVDFGNELLRICF